MRSSMLWGLNALWNTKRWVFGFGRIKNLFAVSAWLHFYLVSRYSRCRWCTTWFQENPNQNARPALRMMRGHDAGESRKRSMSIHRCGPHFTFRVNIASPDIKDFVTRRVKRGQER